MKDKNLKILSPRTSNPLLYVIACKLSCSMCSVQFFQWNCFNLVDTCNIALILFFKCDVTKFRIPLPLSHTMSHFVDLLLPP